MHTHTVQNHNCHQHLNFLTRGKEATPGTDRPLISPPWEMPMGLSVNCFVFIYFCYSVVNRRERTHDEKQEHTHGRQYTEAVMASGSSFLFNSVFLCLITFFDFLRVPRPNPQPLLKTKTNNNNKSSSCLSAGIPPCFPH